MPTMRKPKQQTQLRKRKRKRKRRTPKIASRTTLIKLARLFLMWFNDDGSPCDGFRFQEQRQALSDAVQFEHWFANLDK